MGLEAIDPRPRLSQGGADPRVYPYLLRGEMLHRPHQVWSADSTDVPMRQGCMYLVASLDWYRRYVVSWHLEYDGCGVVLDRTRRGADARATRDFNTDQGARYRSGLHHAVGDRPGGHQHGRTGARV